jgi:hypothetical protein
MVVAAGALALGGAVRTAQQWMRGWGATLRERRMDLPGDELAPDAATVHTRAITATAPVDAVWRWLVQIGQDRSGFYSYTWLENAVGCRMPRVHELRDEWRCRVLGDRILMAPEERFDGKAYNVVQRVQPNEALVAVAPGDLERLDRGEQATWVWQFIVRPGETESTSRLIVRSRYLTPNRFLEPIHFIMERKMMKTIVELAERTYVPMVADPVAFAVA